MAYHPVQVSKIYRNRWYYNIILLSYMVLYNFKISKKYYKLYNNINYNITIINYEPTEWIDFVEYSIKMLSKSKNINLLFFNFKNYNICHTLIYFEYSIYGYLLTMIINFISNIFVISNDEAYGVYHRYFFLT